MSPDRYYREAIGSVREELAEHGVLESADELMAARADDTVEEMWAHDFTVALDLMIAGIESLLAKNP